MRRLLLVMLAIGAVATACSGDDDDDDDGGTPADVSGTVTMNDGDDDDTPLVGATVEVAGDASSSVTTGSGGTYTITIDAGEDTFLRASGGGLYPTQRGVVATAAGLSGVNLSGPSAALVAGVGGALGVTLDPAKGILSANLNGASITTAGGIAITITLDADGAFTFSSNGTPTLSTTTLPNGDPSLIFYNVTPGSTTLTIDGGPTGCANPYGITSFRVDAGTITEAQFDCD